jgi:glutamine amidotransferase-like uncharacterized protein
MVDKIMNSDNRPIMKNFTVAIGKIVFISLTIFTLGLCANAVCLQADSTSDKGHGPLVLNKDKQPVRVAIYTGDGAYFRSITAASQMFSWMGASPQRITPQDIKDDQLQSFDILYMTGGWAVPYIRDLKDGGTAKIREFVQRGGAFLGTCAGAFFAADYIYWEGQRYEYPLDLFPGYAKGAIAEIAPWPSFKLCRINLSKTPHPIIKGEPQSLMILYWGGPWFDAPPGFKADILAYYDFNSRPAMLAFEYGGGRVFLTGVHTEFEEGGDRDNVRWGDSLHDPESEWPLMLKAVRWLVAYKQSP